MTAAVHRLVLVLAKCDNERNTPCHFGRSFIADSVEPIRPGVDEEDGVVREVALLLKADMAARPINPPTHAGGFVAGAGDSSQGGVGVVWRPSSRPLLSPSPPHRSRSHPLTCRIARLPHGAADGGRDGGAARYSSSVVARWWWPMDPPKPPRVVTHSLVNFPS